MQFYFIRHGQSENNVLWARTGASVGRSQDPELSPAGQQQAEILAEFLRRSDPSATASSRDEQNVAGLAITHLYTSLMVRSVATGTAVARALGLPLVAWEEWHESGGIYLRDDQTEEHIGQPGNNRAYFEAHYPDLVLPDSLDESGWWNRPYEEPEQRPIRAQRALRDLIRRHGQTEDRVTIISHGGFYNHFLAALLNLPRRDGYWFALNNAAITRLDFRPIEPPPPDPLLDEPGESQPIEWAISLIYHNRLDFMPRDLIT
jgi:2,3-bisphosphoglycerate-dependent phosphoglycerate mutase